MSIMSVHVQSESWPWLECPKTERGKLASSMQAECIMAACFKTSITYEVSYSQKVSGNRKHAVKSTCRQAISSDLRVSASIMALYVPLGLV